VKACFKELLAELSSPIRIFLIVLFGKMPANTANKSRQLLGRETLTVLEHYRADKGFLGSSGFTAKRGHGTQSKRRSEITLRLANCMINWWHREKK
jgi:DeoR/GlpR family transcriptional regulator of sugar metabolism